MVKLEDSPSGYVRPSVVNEADIRAMDSEDMDDGGWAGAQEEMDYSVKLNFDDEEPSTDSSDCQKSSIIGNKHNDHINKQQVSRLPNGDISRTQVSSLKHVELAYTNLNVCGLYPDC